MNTSNAIKSFFNRRLNRDAVFTTLTVQKREGNTNPETRKHKNRLYSPRTCVYIPSPTMLVIGTQPRVIPEAG